MSRAAGRRGMLVVALVLLVLLVIADTLRPNSVLRDFFGGAPAQQDRLEDIRRRGIPIPERTGMVVPGDVTSTAQSLPA